LARKYTKSVSLKFARDHRFNGTVYKYMSVDDALLTINNSTIFLQNPSKFNDPYDCYHGLIDSKKIEREYSIEILDHPSFSHLSPRIKESLKKKINSGELDVRQPFIDTLNFAKSRIGISCFSTLNKNLLMWSHYANKHKGVCIGFNFNIAPPLNLFQAKVVYKKKFDKSVNFFANPDDFYSNWLLTKSIDWKYEKEVRLVSLEKKGVYKIDSKNIIEVFFGSKTSKLDQEKLTIELKKMEYSVIIKKLVLKEKEFKLVEEEA